MPSLSEKFTSFKPYASESVAPTTDGYSIYDMATNSYKIYNVAASAWVTLALAPPKSQGFAPFDLNGLANNITVINDTTIQHSAIGIWEGARTGGVSLLAGKYYVEVIGGVNATSSTMVGIGNSDQDNAVLSTPYNDSSVVHFYSAVGVTYGGGSPGNDPAYTNISGFSNGEVIMIAIDIGLRRVYFGKNGVWGTGTYNANPSAGTGGILCPVGTGTSGWELQICTAAANSEISIRTASTDTYTYAVPTGYTAGLPLS